MINNLYGDTFHAQPVLARILKALSPEPEKEIGG